MVDGYDAKSCNAQQRPYYRPVEAAICWCNLKQHEGAILAAIDADGVPKPGQFPQWPCLLANTEKIMDAIEHGEIRCGRDGRTVTDGDHVAPARRTIRHTDLREWMAKHHPGSKPAFLFDEVERQAHPSITQAAYQALAAENVTHKARAEKLAEQLRAATAERDVVAGERDAIKAILDRQGPTTARAETTYLNIIGALLALVLSPRSGRDSEAAVIRELIDNYGDKAGVSKTTLEAKFAEAKRSLQA